jgi:hypothetical protein
MARYKYLDIRLIDVPFAGDGAFAPIEARKQLFLRELCHPPNKAAYFHPNVP